MMNYKHLMFIAVALATAALLVMPAMATDKYYESKYKDTNPALDLQNDAQTYQGYAIFRPRAGGSELDPYVFISNDAAPGLKPFDTSFNLDGSGTETSTNQTGYLMIKVNPDGQSDPVALIPGNYTAHIRFGNGNQPETVKFTIAAHDTVYVPYLGSAKPSNSEVTPEVMPVSGCKDLDIEYASYGGNFAKGLGWNLVNAVFHHNQYVAVTSKVQSMVVSDTLHIPADYGDQHYNALFGDPNPGVVKGLYVLYTCKVTKQQHGHTITVTVPHTKYVSEEQDLTIN